MDTNIDSAGPAPDAPSLQNPHHGLGLWLREGLRAAFFLAPRLSGRPQPAHVLALVAGVAGLELALARFEVRGPAVFSLHHWLASWWSVGLLLLAAWWLLPQRDEVAQDRPAGVAAWYFLTLVAALPLILLSGLLSVARGRGAMPEFLQAGWAAWAVYLALWTWSLGVTLRLSRRFGMGVARLAALAVVLLAIGMVSDWYFTGRPWQRDYAANPEPEAPQLQLSQQSFEAQQALWRQQVEAIAAGRPGVIDVYGVVFAPYAYEDVFLKESTMVAGLLAERFDAKGRVLQLVNHASTAATQPWATPLNLQRAVQALAARMDREEDVLVVYLTSHGGRDFRLAAEHGPLQVEDLTAQHLRQALEIAGIRHRVIAVSACYSGGWVEPLATDTTLVMTAADATHTSYGCGTRSEMTFFGRAVFDEQLRKTRSFEEAFAAAVPVIRQREEEGRKPDGFSNPQIRVGEQIRPVLRQLEQRLAAAPG
jgi:hypothetical protein